MRQCTHSPMAYIFKHVTLIDTKLVPIKQYTSLDIKVVSTMRARAGIESRDVGIPVSSSLMVGINRVETIKDRFKFH